MDFVNPKAAKRSPDKIRKQYEYSVELTPEQTKSKKPCDTPPHTLKRGKVGKDRQTGMCPLQGDARFRVGGNEKALTGMFRVCITWCISYLALGGGLQAQHEGGGAIEYEYTS